MYFYKLNCSILVFFHPFLVFTGYWSLDVFFCCCLNWKNLKPAHRQVGCPVRLRLLAMAFEGSEEEAQAEELKTQP